jgi:hypothetical protein
VHKKDREVREGSDQQLLREGLRTMFRVAREGRNADKTIKHRHPPAYALHQLPLRGVLLQTAAER